ncbi:TadE/TadG family type IV pilus assembly protein [Lonepinella sp. MS14437]|uniref:TadE/TadG family type IV pilus assembly protein n=1 Tax=Lonepinella sp. MS14437 TaxID=3003620 RepID=UPI0036DCFB97
MIKNLKKMLVNPNGVSTIEFSLTVGIFFFVVFLIFELCRLAIISAYWDLAITESVRIAKNQQPESNGDYKTQFEKILKEQRNNLQNGTIAFLGETNNKLAVDVKYAESNSIDDLVNERFKKDPKDKTKLSSSGSGAVLALYTVKYSYQPVVPLPFLPISWTNRLLERNIVMVQEYERFSQNQSTNAN